MKRTAVVLITGALVLALAGDAGAGKGKQQKVKGSIAFPAPFAQGTFDGCWGGLHRRIITVLQGQPNGVFGYHFDVDKKTWNKPFALKVTGGQGSVDLDLFLYSHVPPLDEWPNDPVNSGTPVSVDYTTREPGGEAGIVPPKTTSAIVCMYGGPSHAGFDASFTYTAGKGVKAPK
jgi:hypothetical protein